MNIDSAAVLALIRQRKDHYLAKADEHEAHAPDSHTTHETFVLCAEAMEWLEAEVGRIGA